MRPNPRLVSEAEALHIGPKQPKVPMAEVFELRPQAKL
jgi:hypothetical protein